jgi:hypothetical protein
MKCPWCNINDRNCVPEVAYRNCENYGSNFYDILCRRCGKPVTVYLHRQVKLGSLNKGEHKDDTFGYMPLKKKGEMK